MNKLNLIKGIFVSKLFRKPFYTHLYVTRRCNMRCKMCNIWRHRYEKEMNLEEIKIAAQRMRKIGVFQTVITGGESLLREDISEIISVLSKSGISTRLQTNGLLLTEQKLDELIDAGIEDVTISLDTFDNEKYADIRGISKRALSDEIITKFKMLTEKMPKSIHTASIVVSHKNINELVDLIKFFDSIGIWSGFVPVNLSEHREDYLFKAKADEFAFTKEDKIKAEQLYGEILKLKKQGYKILPSSKFLKQSLDFIKTNNKKWKCGAGQLYFSIFPDGQFAPCDELLSELNILDKNFIEKYKSKEFRKYLHLTQNKCEGCFYGCWKQVSNLINYPSVTLDKFLILFRVKKKELIQKIANIKK